MRGPWKVKEICELSEFGNFLCSPLCIYSVLVYIEVLQGPPATLQVHPNPHCLLLQLLGFCCCCCCCCFCCEVQMQAHLMLPPTPPELQLCPHMPLSWRGLHPQWCKHLGPPHRPLNWGRAGCNAGCNGCIPGCYCLLHIRPEADDELPSGTIVLFRLVQPRSNSDASPFWRWGSIWGYRIKESKYCEVWKTLIYFRLDLLWGASIII